MKSTSLIRPDSCTFRRHIFPVQLITLVTCTACFPLVALAQQNALVVNKSQKSAQDHLALVLMEELGTTPISVDVKNASLSDFIEAVGRATTKPQRIEVRESESLVFSLALKDTALARVLNAAAILAGCELYLLPDRFLIAPGHALRTEERSLAERYTRNLSNLKAVRDYAFAQSVVSSIQQSGRKEVKFADLQEPQRRMLQRMADTQSESTRTEPALLPANAGVTLETRPDGGFNLKIDLKSSRKNYMWLNIVP